MTFRKLTRRGLPGKLIALGLGSILASSGILLTMTMLAMLGSGARRAQIDLAMEGRIIGYFHASDAAGTPAAAILRQARNLTQDDLAIFETGGPPSFIGFDGRAVGDALLPEDVSTTILTHGAPVTRTGTVGGASYILHWEPLRRGGRITGIALLGRSRHVSLSMPPLFLRVLATGLGLTLLLAALFVHAANRLALGIDAVHEELRRANATFRVAIESMSQGFAIFDSAGCLASLNERFALLNGVPYPSYRIGMTFLDVLRIHQSTLIAMGDIEAIAAERVAELLGGRGTRLNMHNWNGREVTVTEHPIASGGWLVTLEDTTEKKQALAEIEFIKRYDFSTRLPNRENLRSMLQVRLEACQANAAAPHAPSLADDKASWPALLNIHIARFNTLHDSLGDGAAEKLLNEIKLRALPCLRPADVLARVRLDELAVLPRTGCAAAEASSLATRLLAQINGRYDIDGQSASVLASIGIAIAPDHGTDAEQLIKNASIATRIAPGQSGSRRIFEPAMEGMLTRRLELEADLGTALADGQFELFYQPLVNLKSDRISCFEALMRWRHPTRGLISPVEFIPIAEESGLIVPLGAWAVGRACNDAASWPDGVRVAVNLSAIQVRDPALLDVIRDALDTSGLLASRLELEVTETVLLEGDHTAVLALHELRALGVRISMDDFGTGHSSLSYLRDFPFNKIKIDKSFVQQMLVRDDCLAIVRAVTGLACSLGMSVTAEGAESAEQVERLRAEGCTEVQGFYYSKPRPLAEIWEMFDRSFQEVA